ncbi:MAG: hypothetical protein MZW92_19915 [Comamonadaceae bacterium]|nr:hypothetical protein [Comamonadaceae bacterium]
MQEIAQQHGGHRDHGRRAPRRTPARFARRGPIHAAQTDRRVNGAPTLRRCADRCPAEGLIRLGTTRRRIADAPTLRCSADVQLAGW